VIIRCLTVTSIGECGRLSQPSLHLLTYYIQVDDTGLDGLKTSDSLASLCD